MNNENYQTMGSYQSSKYFLPNILRMGRVCIVW